MTKPHIRSATRSDVPAVLAIVDEAYGPYVERIGRKPAPMMDDYGRLVGSGCVWVLEMDGKVCGLIVLRREADHVLVSNVAVARAHQGQGLGRKLLDYAEAYAREGNLDQLRLYTNEMMHENLSIYSKLGWDEYDRVEQDGFHRVLMHKRINRGLFQTSTD